MTKRLAVLASFSGDGGVERMLVNLIEGFVELGQSVDLLAIRADSNHLSLLASHDRVRFIDLKLGHSALVAPAVARYCQRERPAALLAAKDRAIRAAVRARRRLGAPPRLVGRLGTNLSAALAAKHPLARWWRCRPLRRIYHSVDHIVAVSRGVADDTQALTGLPAARVSVIANPVITARLMQLAQEPVEHPWLRPGPPGPPVILGVGRLTEQKDFATLLRAFALLRRQRPARLIILGDGGQRQVLTALAERLNINDDVSLPGFTRNPYAFMANAQAFALSSAWEGSPNVLTEALALGVAVVATDCPSGPREILRGGAVAPLVAVGDAQALAQALLAVLDTPPPPDRLRLAVTDYSATRSAAAYLNVLRPDQTFK